MKKKILIGTILLLIAGYFTLEHFALNGDPSIKKLISKLENEPFQEYFKTQLPNDTTKLFVEDGNTKSDIVMLYAQGGPMPTLDFTFIKDSTLNEFPSAKKYKRVYVHQSQTYNNSIVNSGAKFSFSNAKHEGNISAEILYRTIDYFKKQKKKVIVIGHSFGAFVIPNYLALKPNIADKIIIMAGRLDMNEEIWKSFSEGNMLGFEEDGLTAQRSQGLQGLMMYVLLSKKVKNKISATTKLAAGIGHKRFTDLLKFKDLSNVLYVYGELDQSVGRLTEKEVDFLMQKNVSILKTNGGHSSMFNNDTLKKITDFIKS